MVADIARPPRKLADVLGLPAAADVRIEFVDAAVGRHKLVLAVDKIERAQQALRIPHSVWTPPPALLVTPSPCARRSPAAALLAVAERL